MLCCLQAAESAEKPVIRIKLIEIRGNERIEESTIRFYIQTKVGDPFSVSRIREDIIRIYQLGFFTDVKVDVESFEGGLKLTYIVKEKPLIRKVTITGNKEISLEDITEKLGTKPRSILNQNIIRDDVEKIKALYQERGYYFADVQTRISEEEGNQVEVIFQIEEGKKVRIKRIAFRGNQTLDDRLLKSVMETKEGGLLSFLTGSGIYKKEVLRDDLRRIEALYHDRGFLQVEVGEPQVEVNKEEREIFITIPIKEGEQFRIGKLTLEGDEIYTAEELRRAMRSREGEVFNRSQLGRDVLRLAELYAQKGYAFADVIPVTQNDLEHRLVNIALRIDRGPRVYVGEIRIRGNEVTRDKVIRREIRFNEGELFNSAKLQRSRQRLFNTRFFEDVKIETKKRPQENIVDLDVQVKERPTGTFTAGAAFSSQDGFVVVANISE
ncbi:MAG: outer membrane protein assembly factor BamA, partial [Nitrospinota bacterium]